MATDSDKCQGWGTVTIPIPSSTWKTCSCSSVTSWLWPCSLGRWMAFSTRPESTATRLKELLYVVSLIKDEASHDRGMNLTCADEQDVVGAVHRLHSVHHQLTELVVDAHPHQQGPFSQRQHVFLRQIHNCTISQTQTTYKQLYI